MAVHPHDDGVLLGGADAVDRGGFDAEVALCRMGSADPDNERVEVWLIDADDANPNLTFVLNDAARTVQTLRAEGKRVLLHCVQGRSRTPTVAARYSQLLAQDPRQVFTAMPWAQPRTELWEAVVGEEPNWTWHSELVPTPKPISVKLYEQDNLFVSAYIQDDGVLEIAGQDLSPPEAFGDEYEYFVSVEAADIPTVVAALGGQPGDDVLALLKSHGEKIVSGGEQKWLKSLGIEPGLHTWW